MSLFSADGQGILGRCACGQDITVEWAKPSCFSCGARFEGDLWAAFQRHHGATAVVMQGADQAAGLASAVPGEAPATGLYPMQVAIIAGLLLLGGAILAATPGESGGRLLLGIPLAVVGGCVAISALPAAFLPAARRLQPAPSADRSRQQGPSKVGIALAALAVIGLDLVLEGRRLIVGLALLAVGPFIVFWGLNLLLDRWLTKGRPAIAERIKPFPVLSFGVLYLFVLAVTAGVLPGFLGASARAREMTVKANAHTVQTMLESYGADHGGRFPETVAGLQREAQTGAYWKALTNPVDQAAPAIVDAGGQAVAGAVCYDRDRTMAEAYVLKAYGRNGTFLKDKGREFALTP